MEKNKDIEKFEPIEKNNQYKKIFFEIIGKYFNLIMLFIVLIVFAIGYGYILEPKYDNVSTVIAQRNTLKLNNLAILENNLNTINRYKQTYNKIGEERLYKINTILPPFESNEEFFTMFEEMILKRGYLLTSLNVSSDASAHVSAKKASVAAATTGKDPQIGTINISMSLIGIDYKGMKTLLKMIENNLRIMDITTLNFQYDSETLSLDISTYYLK